MEQFPKVESVKTLPDYRLLVTFKNKVVRMYDCQPLLKEDMFSPLQAGSLFTQVQVDVGGYGIVWNDDIDLSESELWLNGIEVEDATLESAHS